jgi:glycosyltransferase involved in cell wall biosynthesis
VGYGPEESKLRAQAVELGVADSVRFTGRLAHEDIPTLLRHHHAYVQPSISHAETLQEEGQPIAVLEAIASGIPVIVTDTGGMGETVKTRGCECGALIVEPESAEAIASALEAVLHGSPSARVRARYAAHVATVHAQSAQLTATEALYREMLAGGARPSTTSPRSAQEGHHGEQYPDTRASAQRVHG